MPARVPDRAVLFVDGSNWYHGLRSLGETNLMRLNYARVSEKLVGPRTWVGTLKQGKKVYSASAQPGAQLARVVTKAIPIRSQWLRDCYD